MKRKYIYIFLLEVKFNRKPPAMAKGKPLPSKALIVSHTHKKTKCTYSLD